MVVEARDVEGVEALEEGGVGGDRAEGIEADTAVVDRGGGRGIRRRRRMRRNRNEGEEGEEGERE